MIKLFFTTQYNSYKSIRKTNFDDDSFRVSHINFNPFGGGAANQVSILANGLNNQGICAKIYYLRVFDHQKSNFNKLEIPLLKYSKICSSQLPIKILNKLAYLRAGYIGDIYGMFEKTYYRSITRSLPDIIHVHNIHGGWFPLKLLIRLASVAPLVWTLHDEWVFTGHCTSTLECERWKTGCGDCPNLSYYPELKRDLTSKIQKQKLIVYEQLAKMNVAFITPSYYLAEFIRESKIWPGFLKVIPYGIDINSFSPTEKIQARNQLNLPKDKRIILFSADGGSKNPLKNFKLVTEAFNFLSNKEKYVAIELGNQNGENSNNKGIMYISPGYITDIGHLSLYYSAADLFVYPTKADSFGLVLTESMACELPVLATRIGGVPEQVIDDLTGKLLPKNITPRDLAHQIENMFLSPEVLHHIGLNARRRVKKLYNDSRMVQDYISLYKSLMAMN
jgi:glycosyltransferase involved in cell wall biosynthesis